MNRPIEAHGLVKSYGAVKAVQGLSLHLDSAEALGLLGPNGAGKSTALSMLMGLRPPDAGQVRIFGHAAGSAAARARMGVTPQTAGFPDQLSPREVLTYAAARRQGGAVLDDVVAAFGLERLIDRRMAGFSGGEVRRVALALAFIGRPGLVFLDEPTAGLDAAAQEAFCSIARDYVALGGALILTSHHWDEIEAVCDRIVMIDNGRQVLGGSLTEIRARMQGRQIGFSLPAGKMPPGWLKAQRKGARWMVECDDSDTCLRRMIDEGVAFSELTVVPLGLRDIIARFEQQQDRP